MLDERNASEVEYGTSLFFLSSRETRQVLKTMIMNVCLVDFLMHGVGSCKFSGHLSKLGT
jgi:hypothetical protein